MKEESKATKILSSEEMQAKLQLADQIKKIPLMGTKSLVKEIEHGEGPKEYLDALAEELGKREAVYKGEKSSKVRASSPSPAHNPVEAPPAPAQDDEADEPEPPVQPPSI